MKDYYKILNIDRDASKEEIRKQYKKLAIKYHPDKKKGFDDSYFKNISEAYQILINDETRKLYDSDCDIEYIIASLQNPEKAFSEFMMTILDKQTSINTIFNLVHGDKNKFVNNLMNFEFNNIMSDIKENIKYQIIGSKKKNIKLLSLICIIGKYIIEKNKVAEKISLLLL